MTDTAVYWTAKSGNGKIGPMPVSTVAKESCPETCPLKASGCYAKQGPLSFLWAGLSSHAAGSTWRNARGGQMTSVGWADYCGRVAELPEGTLYRHAQAGDFPRAGEAIDKAAFLAWVAANRGRRPIAFTHHSPELELNADLFRFAQRSGVVVNLSANSVAQADAYKAAGFDHVVCLLPSDHDGKPFRTPSGNTVIPCLEQVGKRKSCAECGLCASSRKAIVGFIAHGGGKRRVDAVSRA